MEKENTTLSFYNNNAQSYADTSNTVSMQKELNDFISRLPQRDDRLKLLEIGAGSGRDLTYMLSQGFDLTAIEPSQEMCKIIKENTGITPLQEKAEELNFYQNFDGIYAVASLLHISKENLPDVFKRISAALKDDGQLMVTFKKGDGESFDGKQRFFSYFQPDELKKMLNENGFKDVVIDVSVDMLQRQDTQWMTVHAKNNPEYVLDAKNRNSTNWKM